MGAMVKGRDVHELPPSQWGKLDSDLIGSIVEVRILCVHPFGVGVELIAHRAYGHVNPPRVTDGRFTVEETARHIGEVRHARLLAADPGRQPTLTIRPSETSGAQS